ncbi:MAG: serine protease [Candidatus Electrothrix sp. ATG1]|nr:serine protease [Candidatus Electrothrix sp. ATG1]
MRTRDSRDHKEVLGKKEERLAGLGPSTVNEQEQEQLIRDIITLRSKVNSLPKPQEKISEEVIGQTIFKIQCSSSNQKTETTGFLLRGKKGVITALHGVVGCKNIIAVGGETTYFDLKLIRADIAHDIAILSSTELQRIQQFNSSSLPTAAPQPSYEGLYLIGYPLGLPHPISGNINIRIPPLTELWKLLPVSNVRILKERNSPDISINVLNLEGTALPGQSGAPLINGENQVVGIINGGLRGGTVGVSWAIPLKDIQLQPVDAIREELVRLSKLPLFSEKSVPDPEMEKKNTEDKAHSSGTLF